MNPDMQQAPGQPPAPPQQPGEGGAGGMDAVADALEAAAQALRTGDMEQFQTIMREVESMLKQQVTQSPQDTQQLKTAMMEKMQ